MKDPTVPPVENRKKFMFYDTEQNQTKLKIRCGYDGMSQSQFFRMMILGYVEEDEDLMSYIKKCKEKYSFQGQQKRNKAERTHKSKKLVESKFALKKEEIEDIFDIIEMETDL
jgi:hypothetical protein|tara:strand:- start:238 stop:576 length:339 start_codon:yes stop_codon:yes gene_type:complete